MSRTALLAAAGILLSTAPLAAQVTLSGEWEAEIRRNDRLQLQLRIDGRDRSNWGSTFDAADFSGLNLSVLASRAIDVRFELQRDAGTLVFEGRMDREEGWGDFTFTPNPAFEEAMARFGYDLSDRDVFTMAIVDISRAFVQDLRDLGYGDVSRQELIRMGIHGAGPEFIRAIAAAGFPNLPVQQLVQFRIHGVSPRFVEDMRASGFALDGADLVRARIHGVSPEYAQALGEIGLANLSFRELVQFRIHGVSVELARATREHFPGADGQDLVRMRIHGVSPEFVAVMGELGYGDVAIDDLVQFRIHGVSASYVRELADAGFPSISAHDLVRMRIHGVTTGFARRMKERDADTTVSDLIRARIHGFRR